MYIFQTQESVCNISMYNVLYINYKLIICLCYIVIGIRYYVKIH